MPTDYVPLFKCHHCLDTSWRPFRCDGGTGVISERDSHLRMYRCGRHKTHQPHGYVERCQCWTAYKPVTEAA